MNSKKPLRKEGVLSRQLGDEWLLYDQTNGSIHVINSVAEFVWRMCDGSNTLVDIENHVRNDFSIPDGVNLEKDLGGIIQNFSDIGVLV
jgi:hypothetical protein